MVLRRSGYKWVLLFVVVNCQIQKPGQQDITLNSTLPESIWSYSEPIQYTNDPKILRYKRWVVLRAVCGYGSSLLSFAALEKELEDWDEGACSDDGEDEDAKGRLDEVFNCEEDFIHHPNYTEKEEETVKGLLCAGMSLTTGRMIEVNLRMLTRRERQKRRDETSKLYKHLIRRLRTYAKLNLPDEPSKPLDKGRVALEDISYDALVNLRRQNQTSQAAMRTRTSTTRKSPTTQSLSQRILDRYNTIRREDRDREFSPAGQSRAGRWTTAPNGDGSHQQVTLPGNPANAAVSAAASIKKAAVRHDVIKAHLSTKDAHFSFSSNAHQRKYGDPVSV
ncbi:hypothetical protein PM082_018389 [Marasmius tenuissimus]|nr:hypothetical protein PM082_018389 [Marasmius tenuissimus]